MIIWGGQDQNGNSLKTGSRYNPSTDSWTTISTTNAPAARRYHSAVWTGREMIVWGGDNGEVFDPFTSYFNDGGKYNPSTDSWTAISLVNAPEGRLFHSAVWTGAEMIVWSGQTRTGYLRSGGRYNPNSDTWTLTNITNAPAARYLHTTVWTGTAMIIWGGYSDNGVFDDGGRYNPATDSWSVINMTNAPTRRGGHTAVWTNSEMIVWGGYFNVGPLNTGARYNPVTDSWTATATSNAPEARSEHLAVWTGSEMLVGPGLGVNFNVVNGGRYNPITDTWNDACDKNAPAAVRLFSAIWTGTEFVVWGGDDYSLHRINTGGRYSVQGPIQLLLEGSGPALDQAAAVDSLLSIRDPFPVVNLDNVLNQGADRNTRVTVVVSNLLLLPGETSSSIIVHLVDGNNQGFDLPAEDVRPASTFVQVTFRLPDNLAIGTCTVSIKAHGKVSNAGTVRIRI